MHVYSLSRIRYFITVHHEAGGLIKFIGPGFVSLHCGSNRNLIEKLPFYIIVKCKYLRKGNRRLVWENSTLDHAVAKARADRAQCVARPTQTDSMPQIFTQIQKMFVLQCETDVALVFLYVFVRCIYLFSLNSKDKRRHCSSTVALSYQQDIHKITCVCYYVVVISLCVALWCVDLRLSTT